MIKKEKRKGYEIWIIGFIVGLCFSAIAFVITEEETNCGAVPESKGSWDTCNKTEVLVIYFNDEEVSKAYLDYGTRIPLLRINLFEVKEENSLTLVSRHENTCGGVNE